MSTPLGKLNKKALKSTRLKVQKLKQVNESTNYKYKVL